MTIKRIALVLVVGVASVATFPLSVPVLAIAGGVWWVRRRKLDRSVPALRVYELQLAELQKRLVTATRETEALTRIKYTAWKLRIEKERQYFIAHGVTLPQTPRRAREDEMFTRLEQRMREEEQRFLAEAARIEQAERYRLQDQRRQEESQVVAQRQHELHLARLQAERDAAEMVARTLREDFALESMPRDQRGGGL